MGARCIESPGAALAATTADSIELWPSIAEFFVYDDFLYGMMIADERRNCAYRQAICAAARGKIVVEIGPGPEAVLSQMCVAAGARTVYAIEYLRETFDRAHHFLRDSGLDDRIVLIHGDARHVDLPIGADICVSEIVGAIGGAQGSPQIINAARRFLRPGGTMIPSRSVTRIAAVEIPIRDPQALKFSPLSEEYVHRIFRQADRKFDLRICVTGASHEWLTSTSAEFEVLDYTREVPLRFEHAIRLDITRAGRMDGFLLWLNLETAPNIKIDILAERHCWIPIFFPVFAGGCRVELGDYIVMTAKGAPCENGLNPDYSLRGTLIRASGETVVFSHDSPHFGAGFKTTPFYRQVFANW